MEPTVPETRPHPRRGGFTLVELLIVVGIILVLISILIPVVGKMQRTAQNAAAQSFMTQLGNAIQSYEQEWRAYPGPLTNLEVWNQTPAGQPQIATPPDLGTTEFQPGVNPLFQSRITMSENLVLGLMGGLTALKPPVVGTAGIYYDPRLVGMGPRSLNLSAATKAYKPYLETTNLSWRMDDSSAPPKKTGQFKDQLASAEDTIIPEIVDTYTNPLPILYLRAKRGASAKPGTLNEVNNTIITFNELNTNDRVGQYDLHQIIAYTKTNIGEGRRKVTPVGWNTAPVHGLSATNADPVQPMATMDKEPDQPLLKYVYPFNAYPYFRNAALSTPKESDPAMVDTSLSRNDVPHQKDGFILIGAGEDRVYGTLDDITNFGPVGQ